MISYIFSKDSIVYKKQPRVVPPAAKKYGWEWNEDKHHWMKPDTNEPIGIQDITENFLEMGTDNFKYMDEVVLNNDLENQDIAGAVGKFISVDHLTGRTLVEIRGTQYAVDIDDISVPGEDLGDDVDKLRRGRTYRGPEKIAELSFSYIDDGIDAVDLYAERAEEFEEYIRDQPSYKNSNLDSVLTSYTRGGFSQINEDLLDGIVSEKAKEIIKYMKPMENPYAVYRGTGLEPHEFLNDEGTLVKVGDTVQLKAFTSVSRDAHTAFDFKGVLLELQPSASTRAITLANEDTEYPEYETILDFTQKFKITKMGEYDGRKVFRGEFLEPAQDIQKMVDNNLSYITVLSKSMKYIITKATPLTYTYEEIRKFHELREKVNQKKIDVGREIDVIDKNTLDEFLTYAQSEDPEVRSEGRNGLRNVLLVGSTILVVTIILRKVRSIYRRIVTTLYNAALQRIVRQNVGLIRSIPITKRVALVRTILIIRAR